MLTKEELLENAKPILFNTEMVRAILDRRKKHTRRTFSKHQEKLFDMAIKAGEIQCKELWDESDFQYMEDFTQYKVGDILYVRETFKTFSDITMNNEVGVIFKADNESKIINLGSDGVNRTFEYYFDDKWKPSIHMPKEYARIFLKVTNVKVERLQCISEEDMLNEGIRKLTKDGVVFKYCIYDKKDYSSVAWVDMPRNPKEVWIDLWNSTAKADYKWENNPPIPVYEFERIDYENNY